MDLSVLNLVPEHLRPEAMERLSIIAELKPFFLGLQVKVHLPGDNLANGNGVYRAIVFQRGIKVHDISAANPQTLIAQALIAQAHLQNGAG